jgi:hypothetical protein
MDEFVAYILYSEKFNKNYIGISIQNKKNQEIKSWFFLLLFSGF